MKFARFLASAAPTTVSLIAAQRDAARWAEAGGRRTPAYLMACSQSYPEVSTEKIDNAPRAQFWP